MAEAVVRHSENILRTAVDENQHQGITASKTVVSFPALCKLCQGPICAHA